MIDPAENPMLEDRREGAFADLALLRRLNRRHALGLLGAAGGIALLSPRGGAEVAAQSPQCPAFTTETDGPFPADGTNRAPGGTSNVLTMEAFHRRDIRSSLIGSDTIATGVPLELTLTIVDTANCTPLSRRGDLKDFA